MFDLIKRLYFSLPSNIRNKIYITAFFGILVFFIESSFLVVLQGFVVSIGVLERGEVLIPSWYPATVNSTLVLFVLYGVFRYYIYYYKNYFTYYLSQKVSTFVRSQVANISLVNAINYNASEIATLFNEDCYKVSTSIVFFVTMLMAICTCVFYFLTGLYLAPIEMIISLISMFVLALVLKKTSGSIAITSKNLNQNATTFYKLLNEGFRNFYFLKISNVLDFHIESIDDQLKQYERNFIDYTKVNSRNNYLPQLVGVLLIVLVSFLSIRFSTTSGMVLLSFFYILLKFATQSAQLVGVYNNFLHTRPNIENLLTFLSGSIKKEVFQSKSEPLNFELKNIEFCNVSFGYNHTEILKDLSFKLNAGEGILIKGESGTGKSTILSLVTGILEPSSGSVLINSLKVSEVASDLRETIGYVGPTPYLINSSLRDNLLLGNKYDVSDNEILDVLNSVNLSDIVDSLSIGLDTILSDHVQLSTGQQQRISLARAILKKPKLLILDEATSNLDSSNEDMIISLINKIGKNITKIIVSHKDGFENLTDKEITLG